MKGTKYYEAVREGILYFKNYNEIFVLESFLDRLFFTNLIKREKKLHKKEKSLISLFVKSITEIYNLNIIYRGIINTIDKNLISQFIVDNYLFLDKKKIRMLINLTDIDEFISMIKDIFGKIVEIKKIYTRKEIKAEHLHWWIEGIYVDYYFDKFKQKIDDIEYSTILRIFEILIKKQKEIQFDIIPNVVNIIHEKFNKLDSL
jgi:vacuolar-type H+-ATPase subunit C/Vma6